MWSCLTNILNSSLEKASQGFSEQGHDGIHYLLSMAGPCRGHKDCKGASILGCCLKHSEIIGRELPAAGVSAIPILFLKWYFHYV